MKNYKSYCKKCKRVTDHWECHECVICGREARKLYYKNNVVRIRQKRHEHYVKHKEHIKKYYREYRRHFPDRVRERELRYYKKNYDVIRKNQMERHSKLKLEVLSHYSKDQIKCRWDNCTIADPDMLCIDHIKNNGRLERRKRGGGSTIYFFLKKHNFPLGYQVLCCNHNNAKEIYRRRKEFDKIPISLR